MDSILTILQSTKLPLHEISLKLRHTRLLLYWISTLFSLQYDNDLKELSWCGGVGQSRENARTSEAKKQASDSWLGRFVASQLGFATSCRLLRAATMEGGHEPHPDETQIEDLPPNRQTQESE